MDVVFHDDLVRLRIQNRPVNMALIRHTVLNIIKQIPDKASMKVRRKTVSWDRSIPVQRNHKQGVILSSDSRGVTMPLIGGAKLWHQRICF